MSASPSCPPVTVLGPDRLLCVTIEARGGQDDVHVHAAGQGVWVVRMAAELERVQKLLLARYKISYRVVMLFYRLGRRLRGKQNVADGAVLAITIE